MHYQFEVNTVIPINVASTVYYDPDSKTDMTQTIGSKGLEIGIRPMGFTKTLNAPITVTVSHAHNGEAVNLVERKISLDQVKDGVPSALWSKSPLTKDDNSSAVPSGKNMVLAGALTGVSISADQYVYVDTVPKFPLDNLKYTKGSTILLPFANTPDYPAPPMPRQSKPFTAINSIMNPAVITARNAIYAALESVSIEAPANPDLSVMAKHANLILQDFPVLAPIGIFQAYKEPTQAVAYNSKKLTLLRAADTTPIKPPMLQGVLRRYKSKKQLGTSLLEMPENNQKVHSKWTSYELHRNMARPNGRMLSAEGVFQKKLHKGGAAVWKVDERASCVMRGDAGLKSVAYCFDEYHNLLEMRDLSRKGFKYQTPQATSQIAVMAHDPKEHDSVGWQHNTLLTKINPVWSMGDGCLVRVQNHQLIKVNRDKDAFGNVRVERLLKENNVSNAAYETSKGWIQTALFTNQSYVVVLVDSQKANNVQVSMMANDIPVHLGESKPVKLRRLNKKTMMVFEAPKDIGKHGFIGILARSKDEEQPIIGVYSMGKLQKSSKQVWSDISLNYAAMDVGCKSRLQAASLTLTYQE